MEINRYRFLVNPGVMLIYSKSTAARNSFLTI